MLKRLFEHAQRVRTNLAFRYIPRIAELAVWAASAKAMPMLKTMAPLKLLLDSTIHAHAITHEDAWVDTGEVLWGGVHAMRTGYAARIPIHSAQNSTREYTDICHLTVITSLARKGIFQLHTSTELMAERSRHPPQRFQTTGYSDFGLLDGIDVSSLDGWNFDSFTMRAANSTKLQNAQRHRLRESKDELYEELLRAFGSEKHSQDAWHIRTAQHHQMYAFLTMDYSLVRLVNAQQNKLKKLGLYTNFMTPEQLCRTLGLGPVPPYFFSYTNAFSPVRSDLHMPGERRRSTRRSKK